MNRTREDSSDLALRSSSYTERVLPVILIVAAALRVLPLGSQSLWYDEVFTFDASSGSIRQMFDMLIKDAQHPPLHYLLEWVALRFHSSDFALRLPSAIFGCMTVYLTFLVSRRCFEPATACVAAALVAVSPYQVFYSHEARNYAMLCALVLLSSWMLLRWLDGGIFMWPYLVCIVAGMFTSNLMAATLGAHGLYLASIRSKLFLKWLISVVFAILSYGIWFGLIRPYAQRLTPGHGSLASLAAVLVGIPMDFSFGYFRGFSVGMREGSDVLIGAILLTAIASMFYVTSGCASVKARTHATLILWNLLIPVAMALFLAFRTHFHQSRYAMPGHPFFLILLAAGVTSVWKRNPLFCIPALVIFGMNIIGLKNYLFHPEYQRDDFRALARLLERELNSEDLIIFVAPQEDKALRHYLRIPFGAVGLPREVIPVENQDSSKFRRTVQRDVYEQVRYSPRIWLVLCYDEVADHHGLVKKSLDAYAKPTWERRFAGWPRPLRVYRYEFSGPLPERRT